MNNKVEWDKVNWDVIRIEHTLLGKSLVNISRETGIPLAYLKEYAEEEQWNQTPLALDLIKPKDLKAEAESYKDQLQEKLDTLSLLKQEVFAPEYMKFEMSLLSKAQQGLRNVADDDPAFHTKIKALSQVFQILMQSNGLLTTSKDEAKNSGDKVTVILQKTENIIGENKAAIQVPSKKLPD